MRPFAAASGYAGGTAWSPGGAHPLEANKKFWPATRPFGRTDVHSVAGAALEGTRRPTSRGGPVPLTKGLGRIVAHWLTFRKRFRRARFASVAPGPRADFAHREGQSEDCTRGRGRPQTGDRIAYPFGRHRPFRPLNPRRLAPYPAQACDWVSLADGTGRAVVPSRSCLRRHRCPQQPEHSSEPESEPH